MTTPTWITHLGQYWTDTNIEPEISDMWTHQLERENYNFFVEIFRNKEKNVATLKNGTCVG